MTLESEPDLNAAKEIYSEYSKGANSASYKNAQYAASAIGIHHNLFLRITGDVLVNLSNQRDTSNDGSKKINIGLKLKSKNQVYKEKQSIQTDTENVRVKFIQIG